MDRIVRSFELVAQSFGILAHDAELLILPVLSALCTGATIAAVVFGLGVDLRHLQADPTQVPLPLFALYVALYAIGIFFQAAVVAAATERIRGGNPTLLSALAAPARKIVQILLWALLAATIGMALRMIAERGRLLGRLLAGAAGLAWSLATFFVVPVIVLEDVLFGEVIGRSSDLFSETWGESVAGGVGLGAAAFAAWAMLCVVSFGAWRFIGEGAIVVFGVGAIFLAVLFSTLQGIFLASLYAYATGSPAADGLDRALLREAFAKKRG
jgi:hypothetical protein